MRGIWGGFVFSWLDLDISLGAPHLATFPYLLHSRYASVKELIGKPRRFPVDGWKIGHLILVCKHIPVGFSRRSLTHGVVDPEISILSEGRNV